MNRRLPPSLAHRVCTAAASLLTAGTIVVAAQTQAPASMPSIRWIRVPAGSFQMGCVAADMRCEADERPVRAITVSKAFELMETEVTVEMFRSGGLVMREQPPWSTLSNQPVASVSWE